MPLSEKQLEDLYKKTVETSINISWMRDQLQKGDATFLNLEGRIEQIELEHSLFKGKLGAFIIFFTFIITTMINGIGWIISHFFSLRGGS